MMSVTLQIAKGGTITIPKSLRDSYGMQTGDTLTLLDLGGVFVLSPQRSQIDAIADKIAEQWTENDVDCINGFLTANHANFR